MQNAKQSMNVRFNKKIKEWKTKKKKPHWVKMSKNVKKKIKNKKIKNS